MLRQQVEYKRKISARYKVIVIIRSLCCLRYIVLKIFLFKRSRHLPVFRKQISFVRTPSRFTHLFNEDQSSHCLIYLHVRQKNHFPSICCSTNSRLPAFSYMTRPPFHLLEPCYDVQTSSYREIGRSFAPESSGNARPVRESPIKR